MKNTENNTKEGEWYYDLKQILLTVLDVRADQISKVENIENLFFYISHEVGTKSKTKKNSIT